MGERAHRTLWVGVVSPFYFRGAARACPHQFTDPYNDSMIIPLYINCMARIKYFFEYIRYAFFSCSGVAWLLYYS
jgi:hypothetical protein